MTIHSDGPKDLSLWTLFGGMILIFAVVFVPILLGALGLRKETVNASSGTLVRTRYVMVDHQICHVVQHDAIPGKEFVLEFDELKNLRAIPFNPIRHLNNSSNHQLSPIPNDISWGYTDLDGDGANDIALVWKSHEGDLIYLVHADPEASTLTLILVIAHFR